MDSPHPSQYLPLGEAAFYILLSLGDGEKHGYAILKDVQAISNGAAHLSVSTLYETLSRLLEQGMVERLDGGDTSAYRLHRGDMPTSPRLRKIYRLSRLGRQVLEAETRRMQHLVEQVRIRLAGGES